MKASIINYLAILVGITTAIGCGGTPHSSAVKPTQDTPIPSDPSGSRIVLEHFAAGDIVTLHFAFPAGSVDESAKKIGVTSAALRALQYRGTPLATHMQAMGARLDSWVEPTRAVIGVQTSADKIQAVLDALLGSLQTKSMSKPLAAGIATHGGGPDPGLHRIINLTYGGHVFGRSVGPVLRTDFGGPAILGAIQSQLNPARAVIVAVADKTLHQKVRDAVLARFGTDAPELKHREEPGKKHGQTKVKVDRGSDPLATIQIALPIQVDSPTTGARADLFAQVIRARLLKSTKTRELLVTGMTTFVYAPGISSRLIIRTQTTARFVDRIWRALVMTLRNLRTSPPTHAERLQASTKLRRWTERLDGSAAGRSRRLASLASQWGSAFKARQEWDTGLMQVSHSKDVQLLSAITNPDHFTGLIQLSKDAKITDTSLHAESLQEHAKRIWSVPLATPSGPVIKAAPHLQLVVGHMPGQSIVSLHLRLAGGRHQVPKHLSGVSRMAAAILAHQLPGARVTVEDDSIGITLNSTAEELGDTLLRLVAAIGRTDGWSIAGYESARVQALSQFEQQIRRPEKRFRLHLRRAYDLSDGWPALTKAQIRTGLLRATPAQTRAWFLRYITDAPGILGIAGDVTPQQAYRQVRDAFSSLKRRVQKPLVHVRPARTETGDPALTVTSQSPRRITSYRLRNASSIDREAISILSYALVDTLRGEFRKSSMQANAVQAYSRLQDQEARLVIEFDGQDVGLDKMKTVTKSVLKRFQGISLDQARFLQWRNRHVGRLNLLLANPVTRARWLTMQVVTSSGWLGPRATQTWKATSEGVSVADIQRVARRLFGPKAKPISVTGTVLAPSAPVKSGTGDNK